MIPSIDAYIICWNEERMIRHTLNHYATFCRKITLLNNYSTDNTIAIAKKHYPQVEVVDFDTNNEHRDDILLEVKNNCWKKSTADYVIVGDTDEFLFADNMQEQLRRLNEYKVALPVVIGYNMGASEFPENFDIPIYDQVKTGVRDAGFDKQIIFSTAAVADINFEIGCHKCNPLLKEERMVDSVVEFKLLHYKYLSKEYLYQKHEAYANRLSLYNIRNAVGDHYCDRKNIDDAFSRTEKHIYKVL
nr:glycosyltransferase family 2 protein [uncultured Chitinophaga sp.]